TLTGTNTYLVDDAGHVAVIDPGPDDIPAHLDAILAAAAQIGQITTIVATHRHLDHLPAARLLSARTGAPLAGHPDLRGVQRPIRDGENVFGGLVGLQTPGHTRDSLCLWDADQNALFTGDLVLGTGTAVLDDAPNALSDHLASLTRLLELQPKIIYPGHGPIIANGVGKLAEYLQHREHRL